MNRQPAESMDSIRQELLAGVNGLARGAQSVYRWRATLWWVAVLLAALCVLLISDMLLRREELGLRVLSLVAWLGVAGFAAYKLLRPAWQFSPGPLQVAAWIESCRPEFRDKLLIAVELASLPVVDGRFGSPGFRNSALRDWESAGLTPDWRQFLETGSVWKAAAGLAAVVGVIGCLGLGWPHETRIAFSRLAMPWSASRWPREDLLVLRDPPTVVALGSDVQLEVSDNKLPLPQRVDLQFRSADQRLSSVVSVLATTQVGDVAVGNLPAIEDAIEVRAVGGDDDRMPWHRIDVVKPPDLEAYSFEITPPSYSLRPVSELVGRRIRVLKGSQVEFNGSFSEPLADVEVKMLASDSGASAGDEPSPVWTASLGQDGRELTLRNDQAGPLTINQSMSWQLLVATDEGLQVLQPEVWSIEIVPDAPPVVSFYPAEMTELSTAAQLPLAGISIDDLGLIEINARLQIDGATDAELRSFPIWQADAAEAAVTELPISTSWDVASELALTSGQRISVWLEARDTLGQLGSSQIQNFEIRKPDDLLYAMQNRLNQVLQRVRELVDSQRRNEQTAARTRELVQSSGKVERMQVDVFESIAQVERAIQRQLKGDATSLTQEVGRLRQTLSQNRLDDSEMASELKSLESELSRIAEEELLTAATTAEDAAGAANAALSKDGRLQEELAQSMSASATAQQQAVRSLEALMDRLARNESLQQVQRELAQILSQQNAIRRDTDQMQLERLSTVQTDEIRARQAALSADQQGLARRLDDLIQRARDLQQAAGADQPMLKTQIEQATQTLVDRQASSKMRRSTEEMRSEQFSVAAATQQQVAELLNDALRQLGASGTTQLGSLQNRAEEIRESGEALRRLASQQAALANEMAANDSSQSQAELAQSQSELRQQTSQEAKKAQQAGDAQSSSAIGQAIASQSSAEQSAAQGQFEQAAESATDAAQQLEAAAAQLAQRAQSLEREIQQQQLFQLSTAIDRLVAAQEPVVERFQRLALEIEPQNGPIADEQSVEIRQAAAEQEVTRQMLRDVRLETSQLPVFDWALEQSESAMSRAVAAAQRFRIEPDARESADQALRLLTLAASAMEQKQGGEEASRESSERAAQDDQQERQSRPVPALTSLKLLRELQQDINQQTRQLEDEPNRTWRSQRLNELSVKQQALGKQLERLLREIEAANDTGEQP